MGSYKRKEIRNWPGLKVRSFIFKATSASEVLDWKPEEYFPAHRLKLFNGQTKQVPVSGTKAYYRYPLGANVASVTGSPDKS